MLWKYPKKYMKEYVWNKVINNANMVYKSSSSQKLSFSITWAILSILNVFKVYDLKIYFSFFIIWWKLSMTIFDKLGVPFLKKFRGIIKISIFFTESNFKIWLKIWKKFKILSKILEILPLSPRIWPFS
jgi:hypothetical protein